MYLAYLSLFLQLSEHDNHVYLSLGHHPPEVVDRLGQGTLGGYECPFTGVPLYIITNQMMGRRRWIASQSSFCLHIMLMVNPDHDILQIVWGTPCVFWQPKWVYICTCICVLIDAINCMGHCKYMNISSRSCYVQNMDKLILNTLGRATHA